MNKLKLTKIETEFAQDGHTYTIGGQLLPGVTSILGIMDKPALKQWAANRAGEEIASQWKAGTPYSAEQIEKAIAEAKKAWRKTSKEAKDAGSEAHDWIEKYLKTRMSGNVGEALRDYKKGQEVVADLPKGEQALKSVNAFLKWEFEVKPEWLLSEEVLGSVNNLFAGTIDAVARIDGKLTIIDFKTSKAIYEEYWLNGGLLDIA